MSGLKALRLIGASLATALALTGLACLLPDDPYQRWQLTDGTIFDQLRWAYERIHYDERPVDVAIVGPSKTLLGLSAERIAERLAERGEAANVANFSVVATGRNVQWAILDELFKTKSPKIVVVGVDDAPFPYGHPAFKYVAPAGAIAFPPAPLLHNFFPDLWRLPYRQTKLFAAKFFPAFFGLRREFDPAVYAATKSEFTSGVLHLDNRTFDMDREVSEPTLRAQIQPPPASTTADSLLRGCCNDGDDPTYIRAIGELAKAHGARLIFAFFPMFGGPPTIADREFLARYGVVVDNGDLSLKSALYENWTHLNHAGAMVASDRVASAIADMRTSSLLPPRVQ